MHSSSSPPNMSDMLIDHEHSGFSERRAVLCVLPWSGRHAFVPRSLTLSHFVHPRAAVEAVSSAHEPRGWFHLSDHIEPWKERKS